MNNSYCQLYYDVTYGCDLCNGCKGEVGTGTIWRLAFHRTRWWFQERIQRKLI